MSNDLNVLPSCSQECFLEKETCEEKGCRHWIKYEEEYNCSLITVYINGSLTLKETARRLELSLVRVSQLEKQAVKKLFRRIKM